MLAVGCAPPVCHTLRHAFRSSSLEIIVGGRTQDSYQVLVLVIVVRGLVDDRKVWQWSTEAPFCSHNHFETVVHDSERRQKSPAHILETKYKRNSRIYHRATVLRFDPGVYHLLVDISLSSSDYGEEAVPSLDASSLLLTASCNYR